MDSFAMWLKGTPISWFMTEVQWAWPACETLHFIGLTLLVGVAGLFDLRLLGFARELPIGPLTRLLPWAVGGFLLNLTTGLMFFAGDPLQYTGNIAFWMKMLFVAMAGANVLVFTIGPMHQTVVLGPGEDAPRVAKVTAAISLFCWFFVMYWGRMLPWF